MNKKNCQHGTFIAHITRYIENLLDIKHQETFTHTLQRDYAERDIDLLKGYL